MKTVTECSQEHTGVIKQGQRDYEREYVKEDSDRVQSRTYKGYKTGTERL